MFSCEYFETFNNIFWRTSTNGCFYRRNHGLFSEIFFMIWKTGSSRQALFTLPSDHNWSKTNRDELDGFSLFESIHWDNQKLVDTIRSSGSKVFWGKGVLKIYNIFTGEHPYRSAISIKLQSNFIEITLRHGCSPVNFLHIFRTYFYRNTSWWLLLHHLLKTDISRYIAINT